MMVLRSVLRPQVVLHHDKVHRQAGEEPGGGAGHAPAPQRDVGHVEQDHVGPHVPTAGGCSGATGAGPRPDPRRPGARRTAFGKAGGRGAASYARALAGCRGRWGGVAPAACPPRERSAVAATGRASPTAGSAERRLGLGASPGSRRGTRNPASGRWTRSGTQPKRRRFRATPSGGRAAGQRRASFSGGSLERRPSRCGPQARPPPHRSRRRRTRATSAAAPPQLCSSATTYADHAWPLQAPRFDALFEQVAGA